jgi:putative PIN family toxin of toxin-antitoxin system
VRRIVVDTNVLVSAFMGGNPRRVLREWAEGRLVLCISPAVLAEYARVLARFDHLSAEADEIMSLLSGGENVLRVNPSEAVRAVGSDPDDDRFLECAVAAQADAIVSGDRHLLSLHAFRGIPILSPAAFLESLPAEG